MTESSASGTHSSEHSSHPADWEVRRSQFLTDCASRLNYETDRVPHAEVIDLLDELRKGEAWHRGSHNASLTVRHLWDDHGRPQESPVAKYWGVDALASVTLRPSDYEQTAHYVVGPAYGDDRSEVLLVGKRYEVRTTDVEGDSWPDNAHSGSTIVTDPEEIAALTQLVRDAREQVAADSPAPPLPL